MTWGNFQRASLGYIKRTWVANREIIAAIINGRSRETIKGEDIFSFGLSKETPEPPSSEDREMMNRRFEHLKSIRNGR